MDSNNQTAVEEMKTMKKNLQERQKCISQILDSDNYLEQMQQLNAKVNKSRTNKKVIDYKGLQKIMSSEEATDDGTDE